MANAVRTGFVAECFWAGVQEQDLRELDRRIEAAMAGAANEHRPPARYLGRLLVLDDEVVLVLFEGPIGTVRSVAQDARIPFERLLRVSHVLRPIQIADEEVPE